MVDANGKMWMEKCGKTPKKVKRTKRRKGMAEMNKQTKERNLSFKSLSRDWVLHLQNALSIVGTGYSGFFLNSLNSMQLSAFEIVLFSPHNKHCSFYPRVGSYLENL